MRTFRPFQVRLPSGDRHWTVVDSAYRPVAEADEWLHVRLGQDCAESTTEAYAGRWKNETTSSPPPARPTAG